MTVLIRREPDALAVTWSFATDVLKALSGKERRVANRAVPLEKLAAVWSILGDAEDSDPELAALRAELFTNPVAAVEIPIRIDAVPSKNAITGTSVDVDGTYSDWMVANQAVFVEGKTPDDYYQTTIVSTAGLPLGTLTLAASPPGGMSFPIGPTTISPIATVLLDDRPPIARHQESHGTIRLSGVVTNTWGAYGTGATLTTHNGFPVVTEAPISESELFEEQFDAGSERLVSLPGKAAQRWTRDRADLARLHQFCADGPAERQWWRKFFATVLGRQKAFLLPTWRADLVRVSSVGSTVTVQAPPTAGAINYVTKYWPSLAHRTIRVMRTTGAVTYYTVSAAVDNGDGTATLTVNTTFDATNLDYISLVEMCRLGTDEVTFQRGSTAIDLEVPVVAVQQATEGALSTFADYEKSVQSSRPIELVKITGLGSAYYMTGERSSISYGGNTYVATEGLLRAELEHTAQEEPRDIEITLPLSSTFAQEQVWNPAEDLEITVYRQQSGATTTSYGPAPITSVALVGGSCRVRAPSRLDDPLKSAIPGIHFQSRTCVHRLYDARCGILETDHDVAATIVSISGRTVTVTTLGTLPSDAINAGELRHNATGQRKLIVSHSASGGNVALVLSSPFRVAAVTDPVTFFRACDKKPETCRLVFGNFINYGGQPDIPRQNPFRGLIQNGRFSV